jgi:hypothetical protein
VTTKLDWSVLSDEDFERLIFLLIADTPRYENPQWLQHTHAPDRGRDLSVTKVENDPLAGEDAIGSSSNASTGCPRV